MMVLTSSIADTFDCTCHDGPEDHESFTDWIAAEGERVYIDKVDFEPTTAELAALEEAKRLDEFADMADMAYEARVEAEAALADRVESGSWA